MVRKPGGAVAGDEDGSEDGRFESGKAESV